MDVQHLEFPDASFDLIVSSENFEHLPDQKAHVLELARVLRSDGLCFVASPNPEMFVGTHNPFHPKENTLEELIELFSPSFGEVTILENTSAPETSAGLDMRAKRWGQGHRGDPVPAGVDTTWLHNTHSFFCFARKPRHL
jgi:SAM-dependent methyltransferase